MFIPPRKVWLGVSRAASCLDLFQSCVVVAGVFVSLLLLWWWLNVDCPAGDSWPLFLYCREKVIKMLYFIFRQC